MHDVIVIDEEFSSVGQSVETACAALEQALTQYLGIMSRAATEGTAAGASAAAMNAFVENAREMQSMLENVRQLHASATQQFLAEIDAADRFLY